MHKICTAFFLTCFLSLWGVSVPFSADKTPQQLVEEARTQVTSVSIQEVKQMIDAGEDMILLDVRDREEFGKGHLPGAINISRGLLEFMVADKIPDKNSKIVVY